MFAENGEQSGDGLIALFKTDSTLFFRFFLENRIA